jgi:hypothetical protein
VVNTLRVILNEQPVWTTHRLKTAWVYWHVSIVTKIGN